MLDNARIDRMRAEVGNNTHLPIISSSNFTSFAEQEDGLPGWSQEYCQLTTDIFEGRVQRVDFGGLTIFRESVNQAVINRFAIPESSAFVSISLRNCAQALSGAGRLGAQSAYLSHFKGEGEVINTGPVDFVGISFAPDEVLAAEVHRWTALGAAAAPLGEWLAALIGAFAGGHASADLQKLAPALIADRLSLCLEGRFDTPARSGGLRLAADAMAALRQLPPEDLSVKTLAARLDRSPATLRATYRAHFDSDLDTALVALRLSAAHRRLLQAAPATATVSGIAADHGFLHWGRFAAAYRAMFGELPVETLRRDPQRFA